ncbi:MAG: hypothetical protein MJ211_13585 [Bacteroidales bacterium]|nr:hypothetical protein [Bacteroidales bacterium]
MICILVSFMLLISCTNENKKSPYTEKIKELNVGLAIDNYDIIRVDLIDSIKIIELESSSDDSYVNINSLVLGDDYIYILDFGTSKTIAIFNYEGTYIKKIKHGQGPGELYNPISLTFDSEKQQLLVIQNSSILSYTPNGNYINTYDLPFHPMQIESFKDGYLYYLFPLFNGSNSPAYQCELAFTDKDFNFQKAFIKSNITKQVFCPAKYINRKDNNTLAIGIPLVDTLFSFSNGDVIPEAILSYSKYKFNCNLDEDFNWDNFKNDIKCEPYNVFSDGINLESSKYTYFSLSSYNKANNGFLWNRQTDSIYCYQYDNDEIPSITAPFTIYKDFFVCISQPYFESKEIIKSHFLSKEQIEYFNNRNEEENPALVFIKFK